MFAFTLNSIASFVDITLRPIEKVCGTKKCNAAHNMLNETSEKRIQMYLSVYLYMCITFTQGLIVKQAELTTDMCS